MNNKATLAVVSVPIGNLGDITLRAIETLQGVEMIVCEDTRRTGELLAHLKIARTGICLVSFFSGANLSKLQQVEDCWARGGQVALVSDAGTPGISDPGYVVIKKAYDLKVKIIPVVGISALLTALAGSALAMDKFVYWGFLPKKRGRQAVLQELAACHKTVIFYEAAIRIEATLRQLAEFLGSEREVVLARELTKKFEEFVHGSADELLARIAARKLKLQGEFVVLIAPPSRMKAQKTSLVNFKK